jgi:threonine/homoserine efflux transporter RhtA
MLPNGNIGRHQFDSCALCDSCSHRFAIRALIMAQITNPHRREKDGDRKYPALIHGYYYSVLKKSPT